MKQLLSIEYAKLKKLTSIKVILLIYAIMVPAWMFFQYHFYNMILPSQLLTALNLWGFPNVWGFSTFSASYFNILVGVIVIIIVCNEYNYRTLRQNIIDGLTKKQVIASKFLVVFILATIVTIYTSIVAIIIGSINSGISEIYTNSHFIFIYYLQALGYFSFAFFFANLIRKPALSIILFIVSFIAEWIIGVVLTLSLKNGVYNYFPLNSFSKLTPFPLNQAFQDFSKSQPQNQDQMVIESLSMTTNVLLSLLYISIFFFIAYRVLKKRDV